MIAASTGSGMAVIANVLAVKIAVMAKVLSRTNRILASLDFAHGGTLYIL
jgi:hypothetical protein